MRVELFMVPAAKTHTLNHSATLAEAAQLIYEKHIGCVVIVDDGILKGVITKSDLVRAAYKLHLKPEESVSKAMSEAIITVRPEANRDDVAKTMMDKRIHHAVVQSMDGKYLGLTSSWDLAKEAALDAKAFPYNREALMGQAPMVI